VLLSGMVDHFPDPSRCAAEVGRVVRRRGRFMAYRDDASPFYSPVGRGTENERPVLAGEVAAVFTRAGLDVSSHYLSGLAYRYVASARARLPCRSIMSSTQPCSACRSCDGCGRSC
jgi:hypothetical protein